MPFEHGAGLGLWLVNWGVETLGASVTFEDSTMGGTAVRLRLPPSARDVSG